MNTNYDLKTEFFMAPSEAQVTGEFVDINQASMNAEANCSGHCQSGTCTAE